MQESHTPSTPREARQAQVIILTALPLGVTLFALVGLWVTREGVPGDPGPLLAVWGFATVAAVVAAFIVWQRMVKPHLPVSGRRAEPPSMEEIGRFQTGQIVAMALIEGVALFGGVILIIAGRALPALVGVVMIWTALALLWPRRAWYGLR